MSRRVLVSTGSHFYEHVVFRQVGGGGWWGWGGGGGVWGGSPGARMAHKIKTGFVFLLQNNLPRGRPISLKKLIARTARRGRNSVVSTLSSHWSVRAVQRSSSFSSAEKYKVISLSQSPRAPKNTKKDDKLLLRPSSVLLSPPWPQLASAASSHDREC